jgi:hypothetical protein
MDKQILRKIGFKRLYSIKGGGGIIFKKKLGGLYV